MKPIHDIINYSTSIYAFESGKCGSNQAIFMHHQKIKTKIKYLQKEKSENKKYFSSILSGFQLPKIVSNLRVHL